MRVVRVAAVAERADGVVDDRADARVWSALWIVYLVWGSTYLAIRVGVHPTEGAGFPPLLLAGVRFGLAGALMLAFTARRPAPDGAADPMGRPQWVAAAVIGCALVLGGNGLVTIAEQRIDSSIAALVIATVPIWAALLGALTGRERVGVRHAAGLLLGFAGVAALVVGDGGHADTVGVLMVVAAAVSWSAGSVWSPSAPLVRRPMVSTGMQMLCGGVACLLVGLVRGEAADLDLAAVPARSWFAFVYLLVAGAMLAYTAYIWLLHNARLSLVTTYAYVNPLVAVLLGALLLDEPITGRVLVAAAAIVAGVILIVTRWSPRPVRPAASCTADGRP
jgi:drug/metabolite transporter (DMT)-like permease